MRLRVVLIALLLLAPLTFSFSATPPKAGAICAKSGITKDYNGKKYTCIKSGKKLVWDKGVVIKKAISGPTLSPTPTSSASPQQTSQPTPTPLSSPSISPTSSPNPSSSPKLFIQSPEVASVNECKVKDHRTGTTYQKNNVAFPLRVDLIPVSGQTEFTFVPIDFSDAPGTKEELEDLKKQVEAVVAWYDFFSNGKLKIKVNKITKWYRAPKPSFEYTLSAPTVSADGYSRKLNDEKMNAIVQDFLKSTDLDYSNTMAIMFHMTVNNKAALEEGALGRDGIPNFQNDRPLVFWVSGNFHYRQKAKLGDTRPYYWAAVWVHEILHSQGIVLHAPGNGLFGGVGQNQGGSSWALDAWESFLLGWTNDANVFCLPREKIANQIVFMQPVETNGDKYKIVIVPINESEALVVESRRPTGYSEKWKDEDKGIFVYRLNTYTDTDRIREALSCGNNPNFAEWAYYLSADDSENFDQKCIDLKHEKYLIKIGQSVTRFGVKITVLDTSDVDVVQISRASA